MHIYDLYHIILAAFEE